MYRCFDFIWKLMGYSGSLPYILNWMIRIIKCNLKITTGLRDTKQILGGFIFLQQLNNLGSLCHLGI